MTGAISTDAALADAADRAVAVLLAARSGPAWTGELSSSALATATAIVALRLGVQHGVGSAGDEDLVRGGERWLTRSQNPDGGWGDTDRSFSNISTTALAWAALTAPGGTEAAEAARRAEAWLAREAGSIERDALGRAITARYGEDRTFSVPILTLCALTGRRGAGRSAWRGIPRLPFELATLPRAWFTRVRLPVVSYALPALIAMGLVRHRAAPPMNPVSRVVRGAATGRALRVLEEIQPSNGGFLEATPLTSFVTMSLIAAGFARSPVVCRGLRFIRQSARADGSWPIDTDLSTWVSTLAVGALAAGGRLDSRLNEAERAAVRDWLLAQQTIAPHPYTGAAAGAWAWTPLPGGVPDADDTPGALLALHALGTDERASAAAARGVTWLLDLQNADGGIPTFCRGWGALPFDRSGADLTAHAIRAWLAWEPVMAASLQKRIGQGARDAVAYLRRVQRPDGGFAPLWFGNQHAPEEVNLTYGTSRVLLALRACAAWGRVDVAAALVSAEAWLLRAQGEDGGWGGAAEAPSTLEETGLAIRALADSTDARAQEAAVRGASWIAARVHARDLEPSPIGFYFAKLWYYERLYPLLFGIEGLEAVLKRHTP